MKYFFKIAPTALWAFGFFVWGTLSHSADAFLTVLAIAVHETGHILGSWLMRAPFSSFRLAPSEARLNLGNGFLSYGKECFICLSGPLGNGISAWVAMRFGATLLGNDSLSFFATVSLSLALLNLLPISSFDGGRMLFCVLSSVTDPQKATKVCFAVSFLFLFSLWCISVYALVRTSESLSLFLFSAALFLSLISPQESRSI